MGRSLDIRFKMDPEPGHGGAEGLLARYQRALERRRLWEAHWQECYEFALPQRTGLFGSPVGGKRTDRLFDGTAPDAVDQLAASLLAELTPPWTRWFGLEGGVGLDEVGRASLAPLLEDVAETLRLHFDRSTFAVELHQCFLDLVTIGTAALLFEEAPPGEISAFRFSAIPMTELTLDEGPSGRLDVVYRHAAMPLSHVRHRFPDADVPDVRPGGDDSGDPLVEVLEASEPVPNGYRYTALLLPSGSHWSGERTVVLRDGMFPASPFVCFRWLKAPGEAYGRSPVMKALPDIKTANKVVELVLRNASIAVTGIWMAEDDGVLNPANISLLPGSIIPKAPGSSGLTPLATPGRFDVSQLVLDDLRARIRHALLADRLGQVNSPRMTATEVLERSTQMARILGATYGRLQTELLTPLVMRAVSILRRRGEIPDLRVDGRLVDLRYSAPVARQQARDDARNALMWLDSLRRLGPEGMAVVDPAAAARWLGRALGVPADLLASPLPVPVRPVPDGDSSPTDAGEGDGT